MAALPASDSFSELPIRQVTSTRTSAASLIFSELPIRQVTFWRLTEDTIEIF